MSIYIENPEGPIIRQKTEAIIRQIGERAERCAKLRGRPISRIEVALAIHALHKNGTRLRLADLLAAHEYEFAHDISGILQHINPEDGTLGGTFVPIFRA